MTRRKSNRPKPFAIGPVRVRAVRGPKEDRWYFRAELYEGRISRTVWTGWATEIDVTREVAAIIAADRLDAPQAGDTLSTVRDLMETWIAEQDERAKRGDIAPHTAYLYDRDARRIADSAGEVSIRRTGISLGAVERCRDRMLGDGVSRVLVRRALARLRTAWIWARRHDLVPAVDLPEVKVRVPEPERYTPPTRDVLRVADELPGWHRVGLLILFHTGMRIGELAALRWNHVDLEDLVITVVEGKTGPRQIPISAPLHAVLTACEQDRDRVLGIVRPTTVRKFVTDRVSLVCRDLKIRPFSAHGVRRLMVDNLMRSGADVATAASITGHSPTVLLKYYRQVSRDDRASAIARVAMLTDPDNVLEFKAKQ